MMRVKKGLNLLLVGIAFLWAGFIGAISFLEAPVKFQAPSITLATGLDVGRHVFAALNKVELVFSITMLVSIFLLNEPWKLKCLAVFIALILVVETFWLLPVLDQRVLLIISGKSQSGGMEHLIYIVADAIKLIALLSLGIVKLNLLYTKLHRG